MCDDRTKGDADPRGLAQEVADALQVLACLRRQSCRALGKADGLNGEICDLAGIVAPQRTADGPERAGHELADELPRRSARASPKPNSGLPRLPVTGTLTSMSPRAFFTLDRIVRSDEPDHVRHVRRIAVQRDCQRRRRRHAVVNAT
jgi:hypothetical protein